MSTLTLTRKPGEAFTIGDSIVVTVKKLKGNRVMFSVNAPRELRILRAELPAKEESARAAGLAGGGELPAAGFVPFSPGHIEEV